MSGSSRYRFKSLRFFGELPKKIGVCKLSKNRVVVVVGYMDKPLQRWLQQLGTAALSGSGGRVVVVVVVAVAGLL